MRRTLSNSGASLHFALPSALAVRDARPEGIGGALHRLDWMDIAPTFLVVAAEKGTALLGPQQKELGLAMNPLGIAVQELAQTQFEMGSNARGVLACEHNRTRTH